MILTAPCAYPNIKGTSGYRAGCRCARCINETLEASKIYRQRYANKLKARRQNNKDYMQKYAKEYKLRLKIETLLAYGGTTCNCCQETELKFLTLDHINNDGFKSRILINGQRKYLESYDILRKQGFPNKENYQVLCMNCNFGKRLNNGVCPHAVS